MIYDCQLRTIQQLEKAGIILNPIKCVFTIDHVKFLDHIVDKTGIQADPVKTSAVLQMDAPTKFIRLRAVLGHGQSIWPVLPMVCQPLRGLLSSKKTWLWGPDQQPACLLRGEILVTKANESTNQIAAVS